MPEQMTMNRVIHAAVRRDLARLGAALAVFGRRYRREVAPVWRS